MLTSLGGDRVTPRADVLTRPRGAAPTGRDAALLAGVAAVALAGCWWLLARHGVAAPPHRVLAPHPAAVPAAAYPAVFGMWLVMSVAMMLPPVLPWLLLLARPAAEGRPASGAQRAPWSVGGLATAFAAGYFLVWEAYSAAAAAVHLTVQAGVAVDLAGRGLDGLAGGAVLAVAGVVQLTPLKAACLAKCRSPIGFFLAHWRPGARGAVAMGLRHGLHCLGCCWALMGVAFAVGVMNVLWMALLTAAIVAEQTASRGDVLARAFGVGLLAWGVVVIL